MGVSSPRKQYNQEIQDKARALSGRGNVDVNLETGEVKLLKDIAFKPRRTTDEPTAELADPAKAKQILDDISEVAKLISEENLIIEGHTKGGESKFWKTLADNRAALIGKELAKRKVNPKRLRTVGLPGKQGMNRVAVVVTLEQR
mmetsp:Transcript_6907/g.17119  ORF Transcript_6907/g.17119 Transcript_6907/m.17119 type:complete len:145 (+) Transcript_6907:92-526(+)